MSKVRVIIVFATGKTDNSLMTSTILHVGMKPSLPLVAKKTVSVIYVPGTRIKGQSINLQQKLILLECLSCKNGTLYHVLFRVLCRFLLHSYKSEDLPGRVQCLKQTTNKTL